MEYRLLENYFHTMDVPDPLLPFFLFPMQRRGHCHVTYRNPEELHTSLAPPINPAPAYVTQRRHSLVKESGRLLNPLNYEFKKKT